MDESKKEIGLLKSKVSYRKEEEKISFMKDGKIREGGSWKFSRRNWLDLKFEWLEDQKKWKGLSK